MGIEIVFISTKDCQNATITLSVTESLVAKKISSILHFTAQESLKPSFDILVSSNCKDLKCLVDYAEKKFRDDVAMWIVARIEILQQFVHDGTIEIPLCLEEFDEIVRRLIVGLLYAIRSKINVVIILDDALAFVVNESYRDAFVAMMRPYIISVNRYLDTRDFLSFNPVIIAPGGHGGEYRLAHPDRYVIIFDGSRWEVPRREVEELANS
ncbi:MAG: hypothetical protein RXR06_10025 [Thermoproteus sp.]